MSKAKSGSVHSHSPEEQIASAPYDLSKDPPERGLCLPSGGSYNGMAWPHRHAGWHVFGVSGFEDGCIFCGMPFLAPSFQHLLNHVDLKETMSACRKRATFVGLAFSLFAL